MIYYKKMYTLAIYSQTRQKNKTGLYSAMSASLCRIIFWYCFLGMFPVPFLRFQALNVSTPRLPLNVSGTDVQIGSPQFAWIAHFPQTRYIAVYQLPYLTSFLWDEHDSSWRCVIMRKVALLLGILTHATIIIHLKIKNVKKKTLTMNQWTTIIIKKVQWFTESPSS